MYGLDFKRIPSFPDYAVSRGGAVMRVVPRTVAKFGLIKKPFFCKAGYARVKLNRKNALVHRLVMESHVGPCPEGWEVNHKDGDKRNNSVSNLEYVSSQQNKKHAKRLGLWRAYGSGNGMAKLTEQQVRSIRDATYYRGVCSELGRKYGVSRATVSLIRSGKTWREGRV